MFESSGTVSSSSSQDDYFVNLVASFYFWVDQPIECKHKERICRRAAIAAACHIEAKKDSKWEDFSAKLAFEIYSAIKDEEITANQLRNVQVDKFAYNVVFTEPPRRFDESVFAEFYVEIESRRYRICYELYLSFHFHRSDIIDFDVPEKNLILTPPPNFSSIVREMRTTVFIATQVMTDIMEKRFQSLIADRGYKVKVELSVYIKLNLPYDSPIHLDDKDIVAQRFALIVGMFLEYTNPITETLKDLSLHSAWKFFLLLRSLNYSTWVNEGKLVDFHYESDITNGRSFSSTVFLPLIRRGFSITTNNKIYPLTLQMSSKFTPLAIPKTEDVLLAEQELDAPPQQFRDVVNRIKHQSFRFNSLRPINVNKLSTVVHGKCRYAVTN
ncbi:uncharacterized protein LOC106652545 [Trichogramma pretiosum]|uniref:uncharacterized protein LOC106652545 n=1 Tax=Trichogramma pretiosum TaxID=7493 RepID=UPI0006C94A7F|nr:uncharacterized protein LOC106652545 [Trichogramma pretiosum]